MAVRTLGADDVVTGDRQIEATFTTGPGSRHPVALVATSGRPLFLPPAEAIDEGIDRTVQRWEHWSQAFSWDGPWDDAVLRSALLLKLLLHGESGSMVAAYCTRAK